MKNLILDSEGAKLFLEWKNAKEERIRAIEERKRNPQPASRMYCENCIIGESYAATAYRKWRELQNEKE